MNSVNKFLLLCSIIGERRMDNNVVILDNGGGKIKYGTEVMLSPQGSMTNCTARINKQMQVLVGDQIDSSLNGSLLNFTRPHERGYLTKMSTQMDVWNRLFGPSFLDIIPSDHSLVLTEPPFNLESIQNDINEVIFEEYGFPAYLRRPAAWFSAYEFSKDPPPDTEYESCCTVVDSGFSFSHAMPFIASRCKKEVCKRVNVGGKLLTNYLKEVVSYRQWNMMDEFKLIEQVKEELCYVSLNVPNDLKVSKMNRRGGLDPFGGSLKRSFVLPDFQHVMRGYVKPEGEAETSSEQLLVMEAERFTVPEVLFSPNEVGIQQAGVAEATWQCLSKLDQVEMGLAAANIVLTGGNAQLPQYEERFFNELRPLVPDIFPVKIHRPERPQEYAWRGAARFVRDLRERGGGAAVAAHMVSKAEYLERGHHHCNNKFAESW